MESQRRDRGKALPQEAGPYGPALLAIVREDVYGLGRPAGHDGRVLVDGERGQPLVLQRPQRHVGAFARDVPDLDLARGRRRNDPVLGRGPEAEDHAPVLGEDTHYGVVRRAPLVVDPDDPVLAAHSEDVAAARDFAHGHRGGTAGV